MQVAKFKEEWAKLDKAGRLALLWIWSHVELQEAARSGKSDCSEQATKKEYEDKRKERFNEWKEQVKAHMDKQEWKAEQSPSF